MADCGDEEREGGAGERVEDESGGDAASPCVVSVVQRVYQSALCSQ